MADLKVDATKNPHFVMVTGMADLLRGGRGGTNPAQPIRAVRGRGHHRWGRRLRHPLEPQCPRPNAVCQGATGPDCEIPVPPGTGSAVKNKERERGRVASSDVLLTLRVRFCRTASRAELVNFSRVVAGLRPSLLWPVSDRATPPTVGLKRPGGPRFTPRRGRETRAELWLWPVSDRATPPTVGRKRPGSPRSGRGGVGSPAPNCGCGRSPTEPRRRP